MAAVLTVAALLLMTSCNCGGNDSSQSKETPVSYADYVKYEGVSHNTYVYDFTHDGTHYRSFSVASSGTFVINVTLDSLREREIEQNLE